MVRRLKEIRNFQFKGILVILGCFLMMAVILFAERAGIHYQEKKRQISYIDRDRIVTEKEVVSSLKKSCLVLMDSSQEESIQAWTQFRQIFMDMRVGTEVVDLQKQTLPELEAYETVTVLLKSLEPLKENVLDICSWAQYRRGKKQHRCRLLLSQPHLRQYLQKRIHISLLCRNPD